MKKYSIRVESQEDIDIAAKHAEMLGYKWYKDGCKYILDTSCILKLYEDGEMSVCFLEFAETTIITIDEFINQTGGGANDGANKLILSRSVNKVIEMGLSPDNTYELIDMLYGAYRQGLFDAMKGQN